MPLASGVSLQGSTTVISGVTEVAVTAATTVPVVGNTFAGPTGVAATGSFLEITGSGARVGHGSRWIVGVVIALGTVFF